MKMFQIPAILDGVAPLKDGGMSMRFHTQEIPVNEMVTLMEYYQKFGWLLFKPDEFEVSEIPEKTTDVEGRKVKTPSQRLRSVIYVYGTKKDIGKDQQDVFYERQIEAIIDQYKEKIESLEGKTNGRN